MADYGAKVADKTIRSTERSINRTYKQARKELKEKLADFERKHRERDAHMRSLLSEGKITEEYYKSWLAGQVFQGNQWESKIKQMTTVIQNSGQVASDIVRENKFSVFAENYNYMAFTAMRRTGISFNAYNTQAVARLVRDDPQILPEWKIDKEKDYKWNQKKVNNIVQQGIIQGEDISQITERLCTELSAANEKKMRNFARTAITGAQNAGRQEQMEQASAMGIKVKKQWLATMDNRTRDAHRDLDGETVDYDDSFHNELGDIRYPGDPLGDPANVYNCRCTVVTIYPDYEEKGKRSWREDIEVDGQSYKEWKENKQVKNEPDLTQEQQNGRRGKSFAESLTGELYPYAGDYYDWDEYLEVVRNFEGERPDFIQDVYPNAEVRFRNGKRSYDGEDYCGAGRIDNAVARLYEKTPLIDNNRLILCDYDDAWQYLPNGKDDRRYKGGAVAQVFENEGQTVIAFDRSYMTGTLEESLSERERLIEAGEILPTVFPIESPESVVMHEWGHTVYDYYSHALCYGDEDAKGLFAWHQTLSKEEIRSGLSEYAAENFGEFCAECYAEMQTSNPRPLARKYWEFMEPLINKRYKHD